MKSPLRSTPYGVARAAILRDFFEGFSDIDETASSLLSIAHLHPDFGTPMPRRNDHARYERWRLAFDEVRIRHYLSPKGPFGLTRAGMLRMKVLVAHHGCVSITGAPIPLHWELNAGPALHHVVPGGKEKDPAHSLRQSLDNPEIAACVLMLVGEHVSYHRACRREFGRGVYPTPINWPTHFTRWLREYQQKNGLRNDTPSGQPGYWQALGGL